MRGPRLRSFAPFALIAALGMAPRTGFCQDAPLQEGVVIHPGDAEPAWRVAPSGASFAGLYGDPSAAGPFAFLMRMPAGWTMTPHVHDTGEYLTVLRGTLLMTFEPDGKWVELPAGSVIAIPAGTPMWARTDNEETVLEVTGVGPFHTETVPEE